MHHCASVIVTYFPDIDSIESIGRMADRCKKIIVVDNTPGNEPFAFSSRENITVVRSGSNQGLASALNLGMESAEKEGWEDVFLFDQDSRPADHFFTRMLAFKSDVDNFFEDTAFYVPNFYDRNSHTFAKFPLLSRFTVSHVVCDDIPSIKESQALISITSGMLITCSRYRQVGPFRDDYFIDFIDNEYCLRASVKGLKVAVNCNALIDHAIGNRSVHRFVGLTVKPNRHPPARRYYIARNGVRTAIDFRGRFPSYIPLFTVRMVHEILSILLYENKKVKKVKAVILGFYHGFIGKMGECKIGTILS